MSSQMTYEFGNRRLGPTREPGGGYLNTSLENIAEAFSYGTEALADSAAQTLTLADGASDELRSLYLKLTGTLSQATTVTLAPNTISKCWIIENATTGGYDVTISQGSGADVTVGNGNVKMIATDGAGAGGVVYDLFTDLELAGHIYVKHAGGGFDEVARLTSVANSAGDGAFLGFHGNSTSKFYGFIGGYDIDTNKGGIKIGVGNGETAIADSMTKLTIDNDGHITMPSQSAFSAQTSAALTNVATDGSNNTVKFGAEIFDQNADFNTTTFTFTAPVAGKYQLNANVYMNDSDADCTYLRMSIKTSNRDYVNIIEPEYAADRERDTLNISVLADMDASDTAYVEVGQYEGTAQMDVPASANSNFSGYLVA